MDQGKTIKDRILRWLPILIVLGYVVYLSQTSFIPDRLCDAAKNGNVDGIKLALLWAPNAINTSNGGSGTPLMCAAYRGQYDATAYLLQRHADPNAPGERGKRPLHAAAYNGDARVMKLLLEHGADPNIKSDEGYTPLIVAAQSAYNNGGDEYSSPGRDNVVLFDLLLKHGAKVNAQAYTGETALHFAAEYGDIRQIKFLLDHGANPRIRNAQNHTPADMTIITGDEEAVKALLNDKRYNP